MAIFRPNLDSEEVDKIIEKIGNDISEFGGTVNSVDKTGRKKLAYEIQNFRDGFFTVINLAIPAEKIAEFRRQLKLNDNVLRTMFLELSKKATV